MSDLENEDKTRAAKACYAEMEPLLRNIAHLVKTAPISEGDRAGLAIMILADIAGVALGVMGRDPTPEAMRELGEFMASAFMTKAGGIN